MAKVIMKMPFTDIEINGQFFDCPLMAGDEINVIKIYQHCPDLGCCEVTITATHPDFNEGEPFDGLAYIWIVEGDGKKWPDDFDIIDQIENNELFGITYYL